MIVLAIPKATQKPNTLTHRGSVSTKHHVHESHMFFLVADLTLLRTKGKGAPTHTPRLKIGICFHLWFDKDTIKVTWVLQIWTVRWIARPCQHHRSYFTWILCWFGLRCHGQIWISIYAPYVSQLPIMWEYWNTLVTLGNLISIINSKYLTWKWLWQKGKKFYKTLSTSHLK